MLHIYTLDICFFKLKMKCGWVRMGPEEGHVINAAIYAGQQVPCIHWVIAQQTGQHLYNVMCHNLWHSHLSWYTYALQWNSEHIHLKQLLPMTQSAQQYKGHWSLPTTMWLEIWQGMGPCIGSCKWLCVLVCAAFSVVKNRSAGRIKRQKSSTETMAWRINMLPYACG